MIYIIIILVIYAVFVTILAMHNRNTKQYWIDRADFLETENKGLWIIVTDKDKPAGEKGMGIVND